MLTGGDDHRITHRPGTAMFLDVVLIFFEEIFHGGKGRFGAGLSQTAQGRLGNGRPQIADGVNILHAALAAGDAREDFQQLGCSQAAGCAFAAGF